MEKRNTIRVPFHVRSIVKYKDKTIDGDVINLSTGGMLLNTADIVPVDESVQISIFLYGSSSHLALDITGKVVRGSAKGLAVKFTELDLDSFIHLRNIISRNAFDEEKIIKEFEESKFDESVKD
jgi:hypothetical protein